MRLKGSGVRVQADQVRLLVRLLQISLQLHWTRAGVSVAILSRDAVDDRTVNDGKSIEVRT